MQGHKKQSPVLLAVGFLAAAILPRQSEARLVALVVEQRELFVEGVDWGETGPYERLLGTAYMEVDPRDPLNAVIVNLDKRAAKREGTGGVQCSVFHPQARRPVTRKSQTLLRD